MSRRPSAIFAIFLFALGKTGCLLLVVGPDMYERERIQLLVDFGLTVGIDQV